MVGADSSSAPARYRRRERSKKRARKTAPEDVPKEEDESAGQAPSAFDHKGCNRSAKPPVT
jgi:hypothetical protein